MLNSVWLCWLYPLTKFYHLYKLHIVLHLRAQVLILSKKTTEVWQKKVGIHNLAWQDMKKLIYCKHTKRDKVVMLGGIRRILPQKYAELVALHPQ